MFNLAASASNVSVDAAGRPRHIRRDGRRLDISALESVRDETAAYPSASGPRTVFVVTASGQRYRLVHLLRDRRWTIEPLVAGSAPLVRAA